ncbi:dTDP-4-dehydrorhamnose 3,5-epimerase family protein [Streptomyces sp. CSDS2]|uniref:dTDP-4-dehydrorhamnose 3,5-epimerase family protein n=1 Tax=Streptomyces sp. CSDS2 TaxID=3055051 RepID=UPI0025AF7A36|nr:dTDP-4-dehydrorhamnose 3,5-epimerase family protein [Streptomyces sp. CSDS2]MDN3262815.1 dTDP-4-dehydrorhamnose 3,5-epimerase family protein [Streptomyces sp. CSDS2]
MEARKLAVEGALEFTSRTFSDDRGVFVAPFQREAFETARGGPLFAVAQGNHSLSRRGVVRGIHYTVAPPGAAKYVYCASGRCLDFTVDIRRGSPTYGKWDAVLLDQVGFRAVYLPVGVGHSFVALTDNTVMSYLISAPYVAERELAVSPLDPELGLPIPEDIDPILSERDAAAPTLAQAAERGLLPDYEHCLELEARLGAAARPDHGLTGARS